MSQIGTGVSHRGRLSRPLIRTVRLGDLHEIFLISVVGMILIIRLQLWATGYPKLGGGKLHIAHLLWGGLLMVAVIVVLLSFVDRRVRIPAAVVGGAGFGFFIDEIGKFTTSDNDYFFKPSAGMIYVALVLLYLALRVIRQRRGYTPAEYIANALALFSEGAAEGLYESEQQEALQLLAQARDHPRAPELTALIHHTPTFPDPPASRFSRAIAWLEDSYDVASDQRWFRTAIVAIFFFWASVTMASLLIVVVFVIHYQMPLDFIFSSPSDYAETASQLLSLALIYVGLQYVWRGRLLAGYRSLERAVLVQLFIGQFFAFIDHSFVAVWAFLACVAMLVTVRFMIGQETRREAEFAAAAAPDAPVTASPLAISAASMQS